MDLSIVPTYRCNSKCQMCNIWQNPTLPEEEITLKTLEKIPNGIDNLNFGGGEPTLRKDLEEAADLLYPKTKCLEFNSNGLKWERFIPIVKKYPYVKIRFSIEGFGKTNDRICGEKNGFQKKITGLKRLKELGAP